MIGNRPKVAGSVQDANDRDALGVGDIIEGIRALKSDPQAGGQLGPLGVCQRKRQKPLAQSV